MPLSMPMGSSQKKTPCGLHGARSLGSSLGYCSRSVLVLEVIAEHDLDRLVRRYTLRLEPLVVVSCINAAAKRREKVPDRLYHTARAVGLPARGHKVQGRVDCRVLGAHDQTSFALGLFRLSAYPSGIWHTTLRCTMCQSVYLLFVVCIDEICAQPIGLAE